MKKKVAIALSGGVDSLVSAYILKNYGLQLIGIHFITGFENNSTLSFSHKKMSQISHRLNIPIEVVDIRKEFKLNVVDYFIKTYCVGKTPNPCIMCNCKIKFGLLANIAEKMGAYKIATGHYARIKKQKDGSFDLIKGVDQTKDQSYFLSRLKQSQLAKAIFPIGNKTKLEVIAIASKNNLHPINTQESQDICFIKTRKYTDFIYKFMKHPPAPGEIIDTSGKYLGEHEGLYNFTVGQRRGINCPGKEAYYVIKLDSNKNRLTVGTKQSLFLSKCRVKNINWIAETSQQIIRINAKTRYRHRSFSAMLTLENHNSGILTFDSPQSAISPGQGVVFYIENKVIGGGWLESM